MALTLKEVTTPNELKTFIKLPFAINKGNKNWLPPLLFDEKKYFDTQKNLSFKDCEYSFVLAYKDDKPVGRILAIINKTHNRDFNLKNVRFGFLECYNDSEVSHALINYCENWGRAKGMNKIIGPYGFTDRDVQGCLIEGFEYEPVVDSACNSPYLPDLIIKEGYSREIDCVIYRFPLSNELPELYYKIYDRIKAKKEYEFFEFTKRKQLKPFIVPVLECVNLSFKDIYGFMPMSEEEMFELAERYLPVLDPKFVKIVRKGTDIVAFMIAMPNMYKGLQKANGRLLPFGIFHILKAMKNAESVNTMLGGVHPSYQKQGFDVFLGLSTIASAKKAGMKSVDTHVVLEENDQMMAQLKKYGAHLIKKFRVFQKQL